MSVIDVGFVGLGNMGLPMARRLLGAGHRVVVCDLDPAPVAQLVAEGAAAAPTPAAVAGRAETVFASLPTPAALDDVALGPDGVGAGARVLRLVDLSTVGPEASRRVATALAARDVALVDAPVSGGVAGATEGTLAIMAAGVPGELAAVAPMLAELGRVFLVGSEPGQGQIMKLANNYLSAAALAATSEALAYGVKSGLDASVMVDVLNAGSGANSATRDKFPNQVLPGAFASGFATGLMCKDLRLFAEDAEHLGVPLFVAAAVRQLWEYTREHQGPGSDFTEIAKSVEEWAGVEVRARVQVP